MTYDQERVAGLRKQVERYFSLVQEEPDPRQKRILERCLDGWRSEYVQVTGQPYVRTWEDKVK